MSLHISRGLIVVVALLMTVAGLTARPVQRNPNPTGNTPQRPITGPNGTGGERASGGRGLPRGGGDPDASGRAGRAARGNDPRIQIRSYLFKETNERLEYAVFVSSKVDQKKKSPLVIALHGLGVPPAAMMRFLTEAAEKGGYIVAAPTGYTLQGWYGANPATSPANLGELSEQDVMNVLEIMRADFNVDERRTYLLGQSMGGAGALYLGVKYGQLWAAIGATAPAIRTQQPSELEKIKDVPVILVHGDADEAVPVTQSRAWAAKMKELKMTHEYREIRGGSHGDAIALGAPHVFDFFNKHSKKAVNE